jgi:hypothetical protein
MDRRPERAAIVCGGIVAGWIGVATLQRVGRHAATGWRAEVLSLVSWTAASAPVQLALFFTIPLYWRAESGSLGHRLFLGLLCLAAALTLWEPLHRAVLRRPLGGALLVAISSFAGLNALLPIFGLSNRASLASAGAAMLVVVPLAVLANRRQNDRRRRLVLAVAAAWLLPALLAIPVMRRAVPAAPLRLAEAGMGTRIESFTLVDRAEKLATAPQQLVCFSRLVAPRGLRDALVHVWKKDGAVVDRIPVTVVGGDGGFRTWSVKQRLGAEPAGTWRCAIETASGQHLGERRIVVDAPTSAAGAAAHPP